MFMADFVMVLPRNNFEPFRDYLRVKTNTKKQN